MDSQIVHAISKFNSDDFDREHTFRKMRQLAAEGTPPVRKAACEWLSWLKQPCVKPVGQ